MADDPAVTASNKAIAIRYFELAFYDKDPARAAAEYMADDYVQHDPQAADGPGGFVAAVQGILQQFPNLSVQHKRVVAEDDLVVIHSHVRWDGDGPGAVIVDIYRLADHKIVEHWGVAQSVPAESANDNGMI